MTDKTGRIKADALVIRSIRHGETSRIVTLFGRTEGKFAVIAKGIRRAKSNSIGGGLDPPIRIEAIVHVRPSRSVQILGQTAVLHRYPKIKADIALIGYASVILEYIARAFSEDEPNSDGFDAAINALDGLERNPPDPRIILWKFQLDLLTAAGFGLNPFSCPVCGLSEARVGRHNLLLMDEGAICCGECRPDGINQQFSLSGESVGLIRRLSDDRPTTTLRLKASPAARKELTLALDQYFRHHHPHISKMSALKMLDQLEEPLKPF